MKVFLSHTFSERDKELALILQKVLAEKEIQGYLAEEKKEYDLLIRDKIRNEIEESDYVVAIVTNNAKESASVNQELGYALGNNIPIIIMLEEEAKVGVLTHGIEPEEFTRENFEEHCKNVRSHILEKGPMQRIKSEQLSEKFLIKRNLLDETSSDFGSNANSEKLKTSIKDLEGKDKPFVLFSACPKFLLKELPLMSKKYSDWLDTKGIIKIKGNDALFLRGHTRRPDLDLITYEFKNNSEKIMRYLELNQNGFVEQGITNPVIYSDHYKNGLGISVLNLFSLTGAFWAFVVFCKQYYDFIRFNGDVDIQLSIHNAKDLILMGFGGKTGNTENIWTEPNSTWWNEEPPHTTRENIALTISAKIDKLTDDYIENKVREISNKLSNAYGLESAMCYDFDGNFNFKSDKGTLHYF